MRSQEERTASCGPRRRSPLAPGCFQAGAVSSVPVCLVFAHRRDNSPTDIIRVYFDLPTCEGLGEIYADIRQKSSLLDVLN